ncbi:hypothetical protein PIB30_064347 [Stylosanthes scabra]|uniref:Uncharacterized protein n=1 Tax=Stylosanthes scabra TaxID=79078 RepID=A0ABU6ZKF8_9FABA|nr:hypothetical protein [Stylosanthes scabra]
MGSRVVFCEYEALNEDDDIDVKPTADGRFDPDRTYEFSIAMLGGDCLLGTPRFTPSSNAMSPQAPRTGPSPVNSRPLPTKDSVSLGLPLRTHPPYDWKATRTWSLPSLASDFIVSSEGWMCKGDETKVEETHELDGVKSEGSKWKELVEEEEEKDPEEDLDASQPMDTSAESDFLKSLMGDTKPVYSSSSSCPTIESYGSNPSSEYPSGGASLRSGNLSETWSSPHASSQ